MRDWTTVASANSQATHVWQDWLNKSGFETEHDHSHDSHDAHGGYNPARDNHQGHNQDGHDHDHDQ